MIFLLPLIFIFPINSLSPQQVTADVVWRGQVPQST